jgi:hypothetical protein
MRTGFVAWTLTNAVFCAVNSYHMTFDLDSHLVRAVAYSFDSFFLLALLHRLWRHNAAGGCRSTRVAPAASASAPVAAAPPAASQRRRLYLAVEVLASLPLDLLFLAAVPDAETRLRLRAGRMLRLLLIGMDLAEAGSVLAEKAIRFHVFKYALVIGLAMHLLACVWALMACPAGLCRPLNGTSAWLQAPFHRPRPDHHLYSVSLYWAVATISSTGYGDIVPVSVPEKWVSMAVMLIGIVMLGFLFGGFAAIFSGEDGPTAQFQFKRAALADWMLSARLSEQTRQQVLDQFDFMWVRQCSARNLELVDQLPEYLQREVAISYSAPMFRATQTLADAPPPLLRTLAAAVRPFVFMPGECVIERGQMARAVFYVHQGALTLTDHNNVPCATLTPGSLSLSRSQRTKKKE